MTKLRVLTEHSFKEGVTSLEIVDLTSSGKANVVVSTMNGDLRVFELTKGKSPKLKEIAKTSDLPPVAALDVGDVLGNGVPDFVVAGLDNQLRLLVFMDNKLQVKSSTPVGAIPTSLVVANVLSDKSAEVIVSTTDQALRCYGWFDVVLDKLAHKVVDNPVLSMRRLSIENVSYSRFVFGDENGIIFVYQYADDRLHEVWRMKVGKEVFHIATGNIAGGRYDEIVSVSDKRTITLLRVEQQSLEKVLTIKAPEPVTAVRMGRILQDTPAGQILLSLQDSTILLLGFNGIELIELASLKTASKSAESLVAFGDLTGDSRNEIVQAIGSKIFLVKIDDEE
ncbi:MAG: hypothetical protein ACW960_05600 [Candidatus Thorarchaeota archaeon]|jgi:hypothetical protein